MKRPNISLRSEAWQKEDKHFVGDRFTDIGFECTDEIMELRIFDLLNLNRIDAETAMEVTLTLYRVLNSNQVVDEGMEEMLIDQYFPFADWRKNHKNPAKVTVKDLVMAKDINYRAIVRIFNRIQKAFYKSREYDGREYRFHDYLDVLCKENKAS